MSQTANAGGTLLYIDIALSMVEQLSNKFRLIRLYLMDLLINIIQ